MDIKTIERQGERRVHTVLGKAWRHKLIFLIAGATTFTSIMTVTLLLSPIYQASALLLSQSGSSGDNDKADSKSGGARWKPPRTLVQIVQSDEVVRAAIEMVGLKRLVGTNEPHVSFFLGLRSRVTNDPLPAVPAIDSWLPKIQAQLDVRGELTSNIITINYRSSDPAVAKAFTAALSRAFIDAESTLYANQGAVTFYNAERQRFLDEYRDASQKFTDFSVQSGLYFPDEQRKNLLKEYSDLTLRMMNTRESFISGQAKRSNLNLQLRNLEPAAHSPWVNGLVASLSGDTPEALNAGHVGDPPPLLLKVYQEAIPDLFKVNGDIAAAQSLTSLQFMDLTLIEKHLRDLVNNKNQFDLLAQKMSQASANLAAVAKLEAEEQVAADVAAAKLDAAKVVQAASVRPRPIFPNYLLILEADVFISIIVGIGTANLWAAWKRRFQAKRPRRRPVFQGHI